MTNKKYLVGILAMVLVFGILVVGCDNGTTSGNGGTTQTNNFTGTNWGSGSETLSFSSATAWSATLVTNPVITVSGTYTFSGNVATLTITTGGTGSGTATISGNSISLTITIDGTQFTRSSLARIVDGGATNILDTLNFLQTTPDDAILSAVGLNLTQFNQIRDAGGASDFLGWVLVGINDDVLMMTWTNRVLDNFTSVADTIRDMSLFNETYRGFSNSDDKDFAWGDGPLGVVSIVELWNSGMTDGNYYLPTGVLLVYFEKQD